MRVRNITCPLPPPYQTSLVTLSSSQLLTTQCWLQFFRHSSNAVAEFRTCHLITGRRTNDKFSSSKSYTSADSLVAKATHQWILKQQKLHIHRCSSGSSYTSTSGTSYISFSLSNSFILKPWYAQHARRCAPSMHSPWNAYKEDVRKNCGK
jgi:hypothetical protein